MGQYLLFESRDAFEHADVGHLYDLARGLAKEALIEGAQPLSRAGLPGFVARYDRVFHW